MSIQSVNPATGEVLETFAETSAQELERILASAHAAFTEWRHTPFSTRAPLMRKAAEVLRARKAESAGTMALEMGKPIVQGEFEIDKCAWACEFYAEHAEAMLAEQPRQTDARHSYVRFDPLGASSAHTIVLYHELFQATYTIEVLPLTGEVRVHDGIYERPLPRDGDFD